MIQIVKEHIGFRYLLIEIQVYTLILLELNISQEVLNKIRDKSQYSQYIRIQDNESIMCGFYCTAFIEYRYTYRKNFVRLY